MKVILINPPTSFEQIYGDWDLSPLDTYTPPLGILHIASYIREKNHEPCLLDLQVKNWSLTKTVEHIFAQKPDIIGFSAMTINCTNANIIAKELKKRGFSSPIILGGSHITAVPLKTLEKFKAIDFGVVGEGEITFLELIETIKNNQPLNEVRGIVWRDKKGQITMNAPRPSIKNLDTLPFPAWDLLENFPKNYPSSLLESKRLPASAIMTSRGCPFHCTFCDNHVFGTTVRHFSSEYTLGMIRHLKINYGIRDLMILDDNFLINKKKLFNVCDTMISEKMDLTWYCMGHARSMTEERLSKIKEAGCWFIELGIESGNNKILKIIKKNTTKAEITEAVNKAKKAGLKIKGNFIFGFPEDTLDTLKETTQFAASLNLDFFQQNFLTVWPGCVISHEISENPEKIGHYESDWNKLAHQRITFVPKGMTQEDLIRASKIAFRRFYLRPRVILRLLPFLASFRGIKFCFIAFRVFLKTIFRRNPSNSSD